MWKETRKDAENQLEERHEGEENEEWRKDTERGKVCVKQPSQSMVGEEEGVEGE